MDPCALNLSVSALACSIAKGKSDNEIKLLSALFNQLGDCLETIAAVQDCNESNAKLNNENNISSDTA